LKPVTIFKIINSLIAFCSLLLWSAGLYPNTSSRF